MNETTARQYESILLEELRPALGCTEPIAIALSTAKGREVLGRLPDYVDLYCSGNIIKNVRAVTVPNSGGRKGIEIAAALGLFGGDADRELEVLGAVDDGDRTMAEQYVRDGKIRVRLVADEPNLYLRAELFAGADRVVTEIKYDHTHFNRIEKNGEVLHAANIETIDDTTLDLSSLNLADIYAFAETCPIYDETYSTLRETLMNQISCNLAIAEEGIVNMHGSEIGRTLLDGLDDPPVGTLSAAYAAAGSDARMSGCSLPVMINSGSGNQGMTISIPLSIYAREQGVPEETLLRALLLANLTAIHEKRFIGKLSAFCGVVSAAAATGAGVAYMEGLDFTAISNVIVNTLATSGGMVCDGAKASCAAKIASSLNTAFLALKMARQGKAFQEGDGLVGRDAEETIRNVGRMAREGMKSTDEAILEILTEDSSKKRAAEG